MNVTLNILIFLREGRTVLCTQAVHHSTSSVDCDVQSKDKWKGCGPEACEEPMEMVLAEAAETATPSTQAYQLTAPMTVYVDLLYKIL